MVVFSSTYLLSHGEIRFNLAGQKPADPRLNSSLKNSAAILILFLGYSFKFSSIKALIALKQDKNEQHKVDFENLSQPPLAFLL